MGSPKREGRPSERVDDDTQSNRDAATAANNAANAAADDGTPGPRPRPALLPTGYEEFYLGPDGQMHQFSVPVSLPNLGYPGMPTTYRGINQIARYYENDQSFIHIGDDRRKAASLSAESIAGYQMNMVVAGLLGEGSYQPGAWDKASIDANKELLQIANANGRTATSMLNWLAHNSTFGEDEEGEGAFLPTRVVADTETLKEITRQVARSRTGGVFLDDAEIEKITSGYQQAQRDQDARLRQGGGETEALPSAEVFAAGEIEKINPGGATANRFQSLTRTFMGLVGGGQ